MTPSERSTSPQSSTSEGYTPLAKRRRVDVLTNSDADCPTQSLTSSPKGSIQDEILIVGDTESQSQHEAVPPSTAPPVLDKKPKQLRSLDDLFKTAITLECGDGLSTQYQIPLGFLCAQSQKQFGVFQQAEELHARYAKLKALSKRAKAIFPLVELHNLVHTEKGREKAITLILECLNRFPMIMYQAGVAQKLTDATDAVFQKNELFISQPTKNKKIDRSKYPRNDIRGRLQLLQDEAVYAVLERLRFFLHGLKNAEKKSALESTIKAAAQRRILLPKEDPATVEVLVSWLYNEALIFSNVTHLCQIHALAEKLGIVRLATECTDLLHTATSRIIHQANSEGITLNGLLSESARMQKEEAELHSKGDPLSSFSVVGEVFKFTLQTKNPPVVLQNLVADAIADSEDEDLYSQLLPVMNMDMRGKIGTAMIRNARAKAAIAAKGEHNQPQVYSGASPSASIKSEASYHKHQDLKQD